MQKTGTVSCIGRGGRKLVRIRHFREAEQEHLHKSDGILRCPAWPKGLEVEVLVVEVEARGYDHRKCDERRSQLRGEDVSWNFVGEVVEGNGAVHGILQLWSRRQW